MHKCVRCPAAPHAIGARFIIALVLSAGLLLAVLALAAPNAAPPDQPADPACVERVTAARRQGALWAVAQVRTCDEEVTRLGEALGACEKGLPDPHREALIAALQRLPTPQQGVATAAFDPAAALTAAEDMLAARPPATIPDLTPAPASAAALAAALGDRLRAAETRGAALAAENRALTAEAERRALPPPAPPVTADQLSALVTDLLGPEGCDRLTVSVGPDAAVSVTGEVGDRARLTRMQQQFAALASALPGSRFDAGLAAGGGCNLALGEGWAVVPGPGGRAEMLGFGEPIERLGEALPTPEECRSITAVAAANAQLKDYFGRGRTPWVWCRQEGAVGICKRDAWQPRWTFSPERGRGSSAFAIVRAR